MNAGIPLLTFHVQDYNNGYFFYKEWENEYELWMKLPLPLPKRNPHPDAKSRTGEMEVILFKMCLKHLVNVH